jgi:hypothetical protein
MKDFSFLLLESRSLKTLDSKKKSWFERIEPGLFRYKSSGTFYTVLKKDGKTKWRNLKMDDKATARRMLADERDADAEFDSNFSGLKIGQLTARFVRSSHPSWRPGPGRCPSSP